MRWNQGKPWPTASPWLAGIGVIFLASGSALGGGGCSETGLEFNYAKGEVVFYYPHYGRLVFVSEDVCNTAECVSTEGPLAGCPYINLTFLATCGVNVGTGEKPENAFYQGPVTVQRRVSSRGADNRRANFSVVRARKEFRSVRPALGEG
jgi:hypothetical protein